MNKELIKKYKREFDHWLSGGALLGYKTRLDGWCEVDASDHWAIPDIADNAIFIINDEYVEFRKALAEGKTIQYFIQGQWETTTKIYNHGQDCSKYYRIKPDEPKFKAGDWVQLQYTNNPKMIGRIERLDISQAFIGWGTESSWKSFDKLLSWQPQPGEWCWFCLSDGSNPIFGRFSGMYEGKYTWDDREYYAPYCEPFIGTLPSFIRLFEKYSN